MKKSYTVSDLPFEERPRERLASLGPKALSIHELIAVILGRGIRNESVMTTSQNLINSFGSLQGINDATLQDIQTIKGLGFAKACQLKAALELARRLTTNHSPAAIRSEQKPATPRDIYLLAKKQINKFSKEHFIIISLDTKNKVVGIDTVFIGTLNSSLVHPRETFEAAIKHHAASIIVAHNHPSGDPEPSDEDTKITKLLFDAGQIMGITMLDHIVLGKNSYFTFRDNQIKYP